MTSSRTSVLALAFLLVLILGTVAACGSGSGGGITVPSNSCGENAILDYRCWVDKFPDTPSRVDVRCGFTTECCQETVQTWEYLYEKAASPRGVADEGTIATQASCRDKNRLADLDGDGVVNDQDPDPTNTGDFQWE